MQSKISFKGLLFIVGITLSIIIISFLPLNLFNQGSYNESVLFASNKTVKSVKPTQKNISIKQINSAFPIRLKIPTLKVNAFLENVWLTPKWAMDVPKGATNAAWFNLGPRPGEIGSAVISGHYGVWKNGKIAVFNNLYKLKKWDKIYIEDKKGITITFVVRDIRLYWQYEDVPNVFISNDWKSHLNLITCQGTRNKIKKSYPSRLVVFSDREVK